MTQKTTQIRIRNDDIEKLRKEVKIEFLKHHPEFKDINLTDAFLMKQCIDWYLKG